VNDVDATLTADTDEGRPEAPPPTETAGWFWPALGIVVLLGLAWRIFYVTVIGTPDGTGGDPFYYHAQANLLAHGHGFADPFGWQLNHHLFRPTAQHPPLYTMALSVVSLFGGESYMAHKIASGVIGAGTVLVVGLVGRRVGGPRAGVIAGVIAAAYPNFWLVDGVVLSEDLFALTIGLTILAAYRFRDRPEVLSACFVGATIALAALVRGEAVMLGVFLAIPLILLTKTIPFPRRAVLLVIAGVACVVVLAPWVFRNLTAFKEPVTLSTNSYGVLAVANCDQTYHGELLGFWYFNCDPGSKGDESQRAIASRDRGLRYMRDHKGRVPVVVAARLGRVWEVFRPWQNASFTQFEGRPLWGARAGLFSYYALALLAIPGFWFVHRRRLTLIPLLAQVVLVCAIAAYAYGSVRFRLPAEVVIVALAALTIDTGIRWFTSRRTDPVPRGLEAAQTGTVG
jgi:4-amino-4-deoxy-L-arabinose transferase-like glycosyltransferase